MQARRDSFVTSGVPVCFRGYLRLCVVCMCLCVLCVCLRVCPYVVCMCLCGVYTCMCLYTHCTYSREGRQRWRLRCHFRQAPLCGGFYCRNLPVPIIKCKRFSCTRKRQETLSVLGPTREPPFTGWKAPVSPSSEAHHHPALPLPVSHHQPHRLRFCSLKTPSLTLHRAFAPALSRPAALLCSRWGEPCLSLRPWIHCPPTERPSPTT